MGQNDSALEVSLILLPWNTVKNFVLLWNQQIKTSSNWDKTADTERAHRPTSRAESVSFDGYHRIRLSLKQEAVVREAGEDLRSACQYAYSLVTFPAGCIKILTPGLLGPRMWHTWDTAGNLLLVSSSRSLAKELSQAKSTTTDSRWLGELSASETPVCRSSTANSHSVS